MTINGTKTFSSAVRIERSSGQRLIIRQDSNNIDIGSLESIDNGNNNKTELDDIASDLKQRRENFNLASNMASISPGARISRKGEDTAQIEQLQEDLEDLKHFTESKLLEIDIKLESLSNNSPILLNSNKNVPEGNKRQPGDRINLKLKTTIPSNMIGIPQIPVLIILECLHYMAMIW